MANTNNTVNKAKRDKKDEFYTQYEDIEKCLKQFLHCFKDKVVYCNCDDYRVSNFVKYFVDNFNLLGLKKLVSTCYIDQQIDLLSNITSEPALYFEFDGVNTVVKHLNQNGDFRSEECLNILKQCDIVVTNPPFSLFREYVDILVNSDKKFLIIGHQNNLCLKNIFNHIKNNKLWVCDDFNNGVAFFINEFYEDYAKAKHHKEGMIRVTGCVWMTNILTSTIFKPLVLTKRYDSKLYSKYDNYDAINVNKLIDIPCDYKGLMGVPVTILKYCNPFLKQFTIVDCLSPKLQGKNLYKRVFLKINKI